MLSAEFRGWQMWASDLFILGGGLESNRSPRGAAAAVRVCVRTATGAPPPYVRTATGAHPRCGRSRPLQATSKYKYLTRPSFCQRNSSGQQLCRGVRGRAQGSGEGQEHTGKDRGREGGRQWQWPVVYDAFHQETHVDNYTCVSPHSLCPRGWGPSFRSRGGDAGVGRKRARSSAEDRRTFLLPSVADRLRANTESPAVRLPPSPPLHV